MEKESPKIEDENIHECWDNAKQLNVKTER